MKRAILEGEVNSKRGKERRRDTWITTTAQMMGMKMNQCSCRNAERLMACHGLQLQQYAGT